MPTHLLLRAERVSTQADNPLAHALSSGALAVEIAESELSDSLLEQVQKKRLSLILSCRIKSTADLDFALPLAEKSRAVAINALVETPHLSHAESVEFAGTLLAQAKAANMPLYFETHAGCITQDLYRTSLLITDLPDLRFTLDIAHYIASENSDGPIARLASLLNPILERTEMIRGCIGNPDHAPQYTALWTETMRLWRTRNPVGSSLLFIPETGSGNPPEQVTNAWALAQQAWKASAAAGKNPAWPTD